LQEWIVIPAEDSEKGFIVDFALLPNDQILALTVELLSYEEGRLVMAADPTTRIKRFDAEGNYIGDWGAAGDSDWEWSNPARLHSGPSGTVYVLESDGSIKQFAPDATLLQAWSSRNPGMTRDLAVGLDGIVYVSDGTKSRIESYAPDGRFIREWDGWDSAVISNPQLAVGPDGSVYVYLRNSINDKIRRYAPDGTILAEFATGLQILSGIDFNSSGLMFVSSFSGSIQTYCVQDFDAAYRTAITSAPALLPPP
jgi:hypothetical protein